MDDYQIVELYWSRSESAIEQTEIKYGRMLLGISVSLTPTIEDAEECVSDTYLAAWNSMPDARPVYLGAFLSKIVRRLSIDKYRNATREKRGGAKAFTEELSECIPSGFNMQTEIDAKEIAVLINNFLSTLDEEKRYVFVRRYFYSDSVEAIAKALNISQGKVKTLLFRTRNALRLHLEHEGVSV